MNTKSDSKALDAALRPYVIADFKKHHSNPNASMLPPLVNTFKSLEVTDSSGIPGERRQNGVHIRGGSSAEFPLEEFGDIIRETIGPERAKHWNLARKIIARVYFERHYSVVIKPALRYLCFQIPTPTDQIHTLRYLRGKFGINFGQFCTGDPDFTSATCVVLNRFWRCCEKEINSSRPLPLLWVRYQRLFESAKENDWKCIHEGAKAISSVEELERQRDEQAATTENAVSTSATTYDPSMASDMLSSTDRSATPTEASSSRSGAVTIGSGETSYGATVTAQPGTAESWSRHSDKRSAGSSRRSRRRGSRTINRRRTYAGQNHRRSQNCRMGSQDVDTLSHLLLSAGIGTDHGLKWE